MEIEKRVPFSIREFKSRLMRVRKRMSEKDLDVLLLHTPENIYYLSGYHTTGYYMFQMLVVPLEEEPFIITRLIEWTNVQGFSWLDRSYAYRDEQNPLEFLARLLAERGLDNRKIGIETHGWFMSTSSFQEIRTLLPRADIVDGSGTVESVRRIKSQEEIAVIRRAAGIADAGMEVVSNQAREGIAERAIAAKLYRNMIEDGGVYAGLPHFISSGHRTLLTHATWSDKALEKGDNLFVELCGCVDRYAAPLFRTFSVGKPSARLQEASDIALEMLDAVLDAMRPGVTSDQVDAAGRRVASRVGLEGGVKKRAGYSVGVNFPPDWGEGHFLSLRAGESTRLMPGMVFHIPQSYRIHDLPPAAFSETVLITDEGHEVLTTFPRQLVVV